MPRKLRGGAVDVVGNAVHIIEIAMGRLRNPTGRTVAKWPRFLARKHGGGYYDSYGRC